MYSQNIDTMENMCRTPCWKRQSCEMIILVYVNFMYLMIRGIIWSVAGGNLFRAGVDRADILDHIWDDCWFGAGGMLSVHNDPRHILMGGLQSFSNFGHLDEEFHSFIAGWASFNDVPVNGVMRGALLASSNPVTVGSFQTDDERKSLGVKVELLDCAGLNEVALALSGSMLAGKGPTASVLGSPGISVWV